MPNNEIFPNIMSLGKAPLRNTYPDLSTITDPDQSLTTTTNPIPPAEQTLLPTCLLLPVHTLPLYPLTPFLLPPENLV